MPGLSTAVVFLLFVLVLFRKRSPIRISLKERFSFERTCLSAVWRLGLPVALERATVSVAQIIITAVITGIGTTAVAANHLAVTAESISYLPAYGVAVAATTLVGQAVGAGREGSGQTLCPPGHLIGILVMTFGGLLLFCLAPQLIRIFTSESEVVARAARCCASWPLPSLCSGHPSWLPAPCEAPGIPKGLSSSASQPCGACVSPFPSCWQAAWGLNGVWLAMAAELCVRGLIFMVRLYRAAAEH